MHDLAGWLRQIDLQIWLALISLPLFMLWRLWKTLANRRKAHIAKDWPIAEGCTLYAHVDNASLENKRECYSASFSYYFNLNKNGETDYYSGEFSRLFPKEEPAQKWIDLLKEKKIPVHYQPSNPDVSAVLFDELRAKYPVPTPDMLEGGVVAEQPESKKPYVLRWPTEMMASLAALAFFLSLLDHLYRVIADRPLFTKLAISLWIGFAVAVVIFEIWYNWKSGGYSFDPFRPRNKGPMYIRLLTYLLNLYVLLDYLLIRTRFTEYFHLHWNQMRLNPVANGAFLAIMIGNYAAFLYNRLESIEESPVFSASEIRPK
jgi:hypothetical protein